MKVHIEYDDFGEYLEVLEDLQDHDSDQDEDRSVYDGSGGRFFVLDIHAAADIMEREKRKGTYETGELRRVCCYEFFGRQGKPEDIIYNLKVTK